MIVPPSAPDEPFISSLEVVFLINGKTKLILVDEQYESSTLGESLDKIILGGLEAQRKLDEKTFEILAAAGTRFGHKIKFKLTRAAFPDNRLPVVNSAVFSFDLEENNQWSGDVNTEVTHLVYQEVYSNITSMMNDLMKTDVHFNIQSSFFGSRGRILIPEDVQSTFFTGGTLDSFYDAVQPLLDKTPDHELTEESAFIKELFVLVSPDSPETRTHYWEQCFLRYAQADKLTDALFLFAEGLATGDYRIEMVLIRRAIARHTTSARVLDGVLQTNEWDEDTENLILNNPEVNLSGCYSLMDRGPVIAVRAAEKFFMNPAAPDEIIEDSFDVPLFENLAYIAYMCKHPEFEGYPIEWVKAAANPSMS